MTLVQYATDRQVILSFLFDSDLELAHPDPRKLKTCFVDSFEFDYFAAATSASPPRDPGQINVPLKQFINFLPDDYVMYSGSKTIPPCHESVTWIVSTSPHVITKSQLESLQSLQSSAVKAAGGNYRNIQPLDDRTVFSFANRRNLDLFRKRAAVKLAQAEAAA